MGLSEDACAASQDWETLKEQIIQNKARLDEMTRAYFETHSGRFTTEDYLITMQDQDMNLYFFLEDVVSFQKQLTQEDPERAAAISRLLDRYLKPNRMTRSEWKKILEFIQSFN